MIPVAYGYRNIIGILLEAHDHVVADDLHAMSNDSFIQDSQLGGTTPSYWPTSNEAFMIDMECESPQGATNDSLS